MYAKYHVTETARFYQGSERWLLSPDPNEVVLDRRRATCQARSTRHGADDPQSSRRRRRAMDPYYLYITPARDERESFLILQPFVPVSKDNQQTRLVSFMTAKSDPRRLRRAEGVRDAAGPDVLGPVQVDNDIQNDRRDLERVHAAQPAGLDA